MQGRTASKPDYTLIVLAALLLVAGIFLLSSTSSVVSQNNFGTPNHYLFRQLLVGILPGLIGAFLVYKMPYNLWKKAALPLFLLSLGLLFLIFTPSLGISVGGASRWLNLGGFSFQPSELAKLGFIIYLAAWLDRRKEVVSNFSYGFLPFLTLLTILGALLILQPDIGTLGVIVLSALAVFFVAGSSLKHLFATGIIGMLFLMLLIQTTPYRLERVQVFLNPDIDPQGIGYQLNQSVIAVGSGGITGLGFGDSRAKHFYIPEPTSDSIFAIIAEELGFVGASALSLLFLVFGIKGYSVSLRIKEIFPKLLGVGITSLIVFQAFVNMAAILGLVPLTGLPLPFISYGGTAIATSLVGVGILANVSREATL